MPESTVGNVRAEVNESLTIFDQLRQVNETLLRIANAVAPLREITDATVCAAMVECSANVAAMARQLGCSTDTLYRRPGFRDMIARARNAKKTSSRRGVVRKGYRTADSVDAAQYDDDEQA